MLVILLGEENRGRKSVRRKNEEQKTKEDNHARLSAALLSHSGL
jgi:hypothetical protein